MTIDKKYIVYGMAGLAAVLLLGAVLYWITSGNTTGAVVVGTAGAAIAGETERRRRVASAEVGEAKAATVDAAERVAAAHDEATAKMDAEAQKVAKQSDEAKVKDGNDLFG